MIRSVLVFSFLVAAFASANARSAMVVSWDFSDMISSPVPTVDNYIKNSFIKSIEKYCKPITSNSETVTLLSQKVTHTDYYPFNGNYLPLDYSDWIFVRRANGESYEIKATTSWDYDLPIPMIDVQIEESENCKWYN